MYFVVVVSLWLGPDVLKLLLGENLVKLVVELKDRSIEGSYNLFVT